jgi:hypothetical protein
MTLPFFIVVVTTNACPTQHTLCRIEIQSVVQGNLLGTVSATEYLSASIQWLHKSEIKNQASDFLDGRTLH